jgi:hypothetical protein
MPSEKRDFTIIYQETYTSAEVIEILKVIGFDVEDYWKGTVDGRTIILRRKET